ncbi:MAG TPA: LuxR C-terminal-related transcriptional regulator [Terriglobales bacterium]|nr:LuxR C-terminal-related transcriptional regulator [Terriglobales bacterium]
MESLSVRENEIAHLVALGYPNKQIGERLNISEQTVKNHLQSIFRKLSVANRVELTIHVAGLGKRTQPAGRRIRA